MIAVGLILLTTIGVGVYKIWQEFLTSEMEAVKQNQEPDAKADDPFKDSD